MRNPWALALIVVGLSGGLLTLAIPVTTPASQAALLLLFALFLCAFISGIVLTVRRHRAPR